MALRNLKRIPAVSSDNQFFTGSFSFHGIKFNTHGEWKLIIALIFSYNSMPILAQI